MHLLYMMFFLENRTLVLNLFNNDYDNLMMLTLNRRTLNFHEQGEPKHDI